MVYILAGAGPLLDCRLKERTPGNEKKCSVLIYLRLSVCLHICMYIRGLHSTARDTGPIYLVHLLLLFGDPQEILTNDIS